MAGKQRETRQAAHAAAEAPVGVFDSGVGGLTVLRDLLRELPAERFVYYGDTGHCPYGVRTREEIQALSVAGARFLVEQGAKCLVIACNTASVSALAEVRAAVAVPVVGVVPAVKPAAEQTRTGKVGVAATEASARGDYLAGLIREHARGVQVLAVGCPDLVLLAEEGVLDGPVAEQAVRTYLQPLLAAEIDQLVLGCTHFPAMRGVFERVVGPEVRIVDSGAAVARQTRRILTQGGLLAPHDSGAAQQPRPLAATDRFWCSGDVARFERTASAILGTPVHAARHTRLTAAPHAS